VTIISLKELASIYGNIDWHCYSKQKNFGPYIINRIKVKLFVPTTIQIVFGVQTIPSIGARGER
jgi:hypothetical protein